MPNRIGSNGSATVVSPPRTELPAAAPRDASSTRGLFDGDTFTPAARTFPTSADGTPLFKQNDPEWGRLKLGRRETIGSAGCAMTAVAMVLSRLSGEVITPRQLDAYLDRNRGYAKDAIDWHKAAGFKGLTTRRESLTLARLDVQLEAGRPALVGVDYKRGSAGGANGTDHWVAVTGREVDAQGKVTYLANDPGTGEQIRLTPDRRGRLTGDGANALGRYRTTGQLQVFEPRQAL